MNNKLKIILSVIILLFAIQNNIAQVKLAQSGMKFLSVSADARGAALGGAVTSLEGNSASLYYNPSSVSRQTSLFNVSFTNTTWIADINYIHAALTYAPANGLYGVFGLSLLNVDYGAFNQTIIGPDGGSLDIGVYKPSALAVGFSYSRALSDKFSVGGDVRYVYQNYGAGHVVGGDYDNYETRKIDLDVVSFDFGVLYKTGYKSLNFGMSIRNFSQEITYFEESFQLPLAFTIGLSMNLLDFTNINPAKHTFLFAIDAEHPRDNKELLRVGGEYTFNNTFTLRGGYITNSDIGKLSYGAGIILEEDGTKIGFDYSFTPAEYFKDIHRIALKLTL
ncbi:MAG: PorV/PorQ family protein [Melioribacteraceae bacterium]|nr:PorV/PorQ family protein [Melioribacteraceae bacterium]